MGGKRGSSDHRDRKNNKKAKYQKNAIQNVEPRWSGIYVTCVRGKETACRNEVMLMFNEYAEKFYGTTTATPKVKYGVDAEADSESEEEIEEELSIEDAIAREVNEIKQSTKVTGLNKNSKVLPVFTPISVGCECVLFIRTRKPVDPVDFSLRLCREMKESGSKRTRYTQRLIPVSLTATGNLDELSKLADIVLKPHFHQESDQKGYKFAIRPQNRNHNNMTRDEVIRKVAERVGNEHGHKVDLKHPEKVILVECFKGSVGMSVVDPQFDELDRYNLQTIFEKQNSLKLDDNAQETSRVGGSKAKVVEANTKEANTKEIGTEETGTEEIETEETKTEEPNAKE
ncbi:hypothetical protein NADFUDRAFT_47403 [Nadsonia fulvescens var. elongata DSM 6958]|uniref:THUMP domain-containing protein n=1 Tax=Nadsonia fulvescens var. elongata DSM 6958 TaxID=857566 RepID=A0A1E3PHQ5_9ASCO|nr:hypothetical protein NADFUDRAFT_47403 [Nadsonia fulvescens var. elongata DSM 6958]